LSAELELAALEARVLAATAGGFLANVTALRAIVADQPEAVKAAVLALVAPKLEARLVAAVRQAFGLGRADALSILSDYPKLELATSKLSPSSAAFAPVTGIDSAVSAAIVKAQKLAAAGVDLDAVVAPIFAAANRISGSVSDAINRGGNEGTTAVADAGDFAVVWIAETDACVHCLAYSGRVCKPGKRFPGGLTYGAKSYYPDAIEGPPRHPHCRCTVEPLRSLDYAAALRREADRSVLRGFSLESESMRVRIDAAAHLIPTLEPGVDAPKSVIDYARRSVANGAFSTRGRP
jgi:hypothetical protein